MTLAKARLLLPQTGAMPPLSLPGQILVTGGRGRLATMIGQHFAGRAKLRFFSRQADEDFEPAERVLEPAALVAGGVLLHLAWSTLPATAERGQGVSERAHDLPELERMLSALASLPPASRPHFIFFSSGGAVYGNAPGRPSCEEDACRPIGWYGRGKVAAEEIIARVGAKHRLATTILRISNPYGYPVPADRAQGIIPHAIRCARQNLPLTIWGDGHARKDFLHFTDFLDALEQVITRQPTGTFNLCAGESHSVLEILSLIEACTGRGLKREHTPAQAWDVTDSRLDGHRFTRATGWRPRVSLAEGIQRAVATA